LGALKRKKKKKISVKQTAENRGDWNISTITETSFEGCEERGKGHKKGSGEQSRQAGLGQTRSDNLKERSQKLNVSLRNGHISGGLHRDRFGGGNPGIGKREK